MRAPASTTKKRPRARRTRGPAGPASLVAIGASAGGLEALDQVLGALPSRFGAPIAVVVHLARDHRSQLAALLQRATTLQVDVAKSGQVLKAGRVYVAPADRHLEVRRGRVRLTRAPRVQFSRPSIDRLFISAARSYGENAIAVVLSGSGRDGSAGVAQVKARGGWVVVQHPGTAKFAAMPENAIATGAVDAVIPVAEIPSVLRRAVRERSPALPPVWPAVEDLLRKRFGTDFHGYRPTTLGRRLDRRMIATGRATHGAYLALLRRDGAELERLHQSLLIKVSSFFRDAREWDHLAKTVVGPLVAGRRGSEEVRIWSAGCATGEEAYSLAMLFMEAFAARQEPARFRVFATDIDEGALATARAGAYDKEHVAGVSKRRLATHFQPRGADWRVNKGLRAHVIFGKHDLIRDPPLASIDLVSCRNVLIYFRPEQSQDVLQRLTYSLRPQGFLFLGRSEGLHRTERALQRITPHARVYQRRGVPRGGRAPPNLRTVGAAVPSSDLPKHGHARPMDFRDLIMGSQGAAMFGVDAGGRLSLWNSAAEGFLAGPAGAVVGQRMSEALGADVWDRLRSAVRRSGPEGRGIAHAVHTGGRAWHFEWIRPVRDPGSILFLATPAASGRAPAPAQAPQDEGAVSDSGSSREELSRVNEELLATSEEQQTLNEELESRNEELETVNEELQSLNEELNTLNEEVGVRIAEADRLSGFLRTILDGSASAVIGCDVNDRITLWNDQAMRQFRLSETQAVGHDLFEVLPVLDEPALRSAARAKKGGNASVRLPKAGHRPGWLTVSLAPVRDASGRRQGYCLRITDSDVAPPDAAPRRRGPAPQP